MGSLPKNVKIAEITPQTKIPIVKGCENCGFTGYKGRLGVFEAIIVDEEMDKFIIANPPTSALKNKAIEKGMITMYQDELIRVIEGLTTIEELERMVGAE